MCTGITPIHFTFIITALMGRKFKEDSWDMKTLTSKINQKCRDVKCFSPCMQLLCPLNIDLVLAHMLQATSLSLFVGTSIWTGGGYVTSSDSHVILRPQWAWFSIARETMFL